MSFALLLGLAAAAGGTLASYLYDRDASFFVRLCVGVSTGFAALGLLGFVVASGVGLTPVALFVSGAAVASPLVMLAQKSWRERVGADISEAWGGLRGALTLRGGGTGVVVFYALTAVLFWFLFGRVMFERGGEIYTGVDNALGDLPFHVSIITSFAHGQNFPPGHTEFDGARLTYPFVVDFVAAMFVRAGASLRGALFWQNFVLALAFVGLLHRWAWELTRDRAAAIWTPVLVLLGGGLGWLKFLKEWRETGVSLFDLLARLPHDYTIAPGETIFRLGNALTTLLIPQRTLLLGLPLAILVWTLWWKATGDGEEKEAESRESEKRVTGTRAGGKRSKAKNRGAAAKQHKQGADHTHTSSPAPGPRPLTPAQLMLAAGVLAGLLPLVHAHSFVLMLGMAGCLALLFRRQWRAWAVFFGAALALAVPQMLWATLGSSVRGETFFGWQPGWESGRHGFLRFWLANAGLFIPLLVAAVAWRGVVPRKLLLFYLPFALCFVLPNLFKFSPYLWDNIKILVYWWIASAPLVALLLARLWRRRPVYAWRGLVVASLVALLAAGSLDVWRVVSEASEQREFDRDGIALAELIKTKTAPRSLILHAPTYNHPSFLTGRRSVMGYAGHLWTHGLKYDERERDVRRAYAGGADAQSAIERLGADYVVVGPLERANLPVVNESFFQRYTKVGEAGAYRLYQTRR
ncbi:MAG TPA: hypothetical protein VGV38_20640 [Pyrinomonadaceae bacterium]|nr:hypothetical protein [Pyrinomonadaceae bacterium]